MHGETYLWWKVLDQCFKDLLLRNKVCKHNYHPKHFIFIAERAKEYFKTTNPDLEQICNWLDLDIGYVCRYANRIWKEQEYEPICQEWRSCDFDKYKNGVENAVAHEWPEEVNLSELPLDNTHFLGINYRTTISRFIGGMV